MKLAMAVGDNRHYVIDEILPRHFLQTARRCGVPPETIEEIFEELSRDASHAMESTLADLPEHFPGAIAQPIVEGLSRRLQLLESADA